MKRMKLFIKSIGYSFKLIYRSSKLMVLFYLVLSLLCVTFPLLSAFVFKYLLNILTVDSPDVTAVMLCVGLYVVALVILQALSSIRNIVYDSVFKKAEHLYDCDFSEKLDKLPMSIIDTSEGKDMIDEVRYTKNTAVYLTYRIVSILTLLYTFCVAFGTLVTFNIWISLLFLVLTVPGIILNVIFGQKADNLRRKTAPDVRKFCYYRWMLTDAWPAKEVRMYDLTEPIKQRYDTEKDEYRRLNKKLDKKKLLTALLAELVLRGGEIAFTIYAVLRAISASITIGEVALYIGFALSASNS